MVTFSIFLSGLLIVTVGAGIGLSRGAKAQAHTRFADTGVIAKEAENLKRSSEDSLLEVQALQKRAGTLEIILDGS